MFRNDYAPFKYAFQYDCLTHLVKSELGKELLENVAKEDLLKILYNRIAYVVDEALCQNMIKIPIFWYLFLPAFFQ